MGRWAALAIDELIVKVEACHTPFNSKARLVEGDNAIITAATDAQQMQVKVDTRAFALANVDVETAFIDTLVNGNSAHVTGLSPTTTYNIWIRTICNGDTTAWIQGSSFTTACGPIEITPTTSYQENFENYPVSYSKLMADCWFGTSYQPTYYPTITTSSNNAFQGDRYLSMRVQNTNSNCYAVLPEFRVVYWEIMRVADIQNVMQLSWMKQR